MEEIDLNIENYNLNDLLKLFNLNYNYNLKDLKEAKKVTMKLHPDKSQLDEKYFLFYIECLKILVKLYETNNKLKVDDINKDYNNLDLDNKKEDEKELIEKLKKDKDFNKKFNKMFDEIRENKNDGYNDWFQEKGNKLFSDSNDCNNLRDMHVNLNKKKERQKDLIIYNDFVIQNSADNLCNSNLIDNVDNYSSGLFSNLQYQDLKESQIESIIPITEDDYKNKKKFNSIDEYKKYSDSKINNIDYSNQEEIENNNNKIEIENDMNRLYKLLEEDKRIDDKNKIWWKNLKRIK